MMASPFPMIARQTHFTQIALNNNIAFLRKSVNQMMVSRQNLNKKRRTEIRPSSLSRFT